MIQRIRIKPARDWEAELATCTTFQQFKAKMIEQAQSEKRRESVRAVIAERIKR